MTRTQTFLNDYKVAPNPMAGVAGRMKSMASMATAAGGGSAVGPQLAAQQAGVQVDEAMHEQNRALTVLRGMQQTDAVAHEDKMTRARMDAESATDLIDKIGFYGAGLQAAHLASDQVVSALDGPGKVTTNEETGETTYTPGRSNSVVAKILRPLRDTLNFIPSNRRASESRQEETRSRLEAEAKVDWQTRQVDKQTEKFQTFTAQIDNIEVRINEAFDGMMGLGYDDTITEIRGLITEINKGLTRVRGVEAITDPLRPAAPANVPAPVDEVGAAKIRHPKMSQEEIVTYAGRVAQDTGVDGSLLKAVVETESSFDQNAVSNKGAQGLGQLMPGTAKEVGVTDPFDPRQNIEGAAKYLLATADKYGARSEEDMLMIYNWGPGNFRKWHREGRKPEDVPEETRKYVEKVMKLRESYQ